MTGSLLIIALSVSLLAQAARQQQSHEYQPPQQQRSSSAGVLSCSNKMISIMQSQSCGDGTIGLGNDCQCEGQASCKLAFMREYLPSLELLNEYSWNETQILCNNALSRALTKNIYSRSSFIPSHGYPLDISSEICREKEELALSSGRRGYHPCSVSLGKFLRYNSLFEYRLFGRATRVHGFGPSGSHSKDTLVDLHYADYPWRWAQGIRECEEQNLTSWNCAFSDLSMFHEAMREVEEEKQNHHQDYVIRSNSCEPKTKKEVGQETSAEEEEEEDRVLAKPLLSRQQKQWRKRRRSQSRELRATRPRTGAGERCGEEVIKYSSVEILSSKKIIKTLRDARVHRPDHMSQLLLYGHLLVMLSRPSDPVWKFIQQHLVYLTPSTTEGGASGPLLQHASSESRTTLLKAMSDVRNGHAFPSSLSSQPQQRRILSVSMHVRQGDSCDYEVRYELPPESRYLSSKSGQRPCYHVDVYIRRLHELRELYGVSRVYLATDSQEMLKRAQQETQFEWIYLHLSRDLFSSSPTTTTASDTISAARESTKKWVDFYPHSSNSLVTPSAVADLFLMKFGDLFLGAFTSHFSKLSFYLLVGTKMSLLPFVSLDYPLSCDTVDDCAENDIMARRQSIEMIINRAPECLRQEEGGWMRGDRDPCGIYL
jgi:hypothetical protein